MLSDLREVRRYSLTLRAISWQRCLPDIWTTTPSTFFWDQLRCFLWIGLDFREVQGNVLIPSFHCNPCIDYKDKDYWDYWLELIGKSHIFNTQSIIIDNNISVVIVLLPQFWFVKVQNWICFVLEKHTGQSQAPEVKENTNTQEKTQLRLTCPPTSPIWTWPEKV